MEKESTEKVEQDGFLTSSISFKNYGDNVYYPIDLNGDGNYTNDWKVFYTDGANVFIISADYLSNETIDVKSTGMATSGKYITYWENKPSYKAISDKVLNLFKAIEYRPNEGYSNSVCSTSLLNVENWNTIIDNDYAEYAVGSPSIEMWVKSWNAKYGKEEMLYYKAGEKGYYVGNTEENSYYVSATVMTETAGYEDSLYYPHTEKYSGCYGYWLSSPSASDEDSLMYIGYNGTVNIDTYNNDLLGIRPVIAIKSSVKAEYDEANNSWKLFK